MPRPWGQAVGQPAYKAVAGRAGGVLGFSLAVRLANIRFGMVACSALTCVGLGAETHAGAGQTRSRHGGAGCILADNARLGLTFT